MKRTIRQVMIHVAMSALLCVPAWQSLDAQVHARLGLKTGIMFANQTHRFPDFDVTTNERTGLIVGGIVEIGLSDLWHLEFDPGYVQKGVNYPGVVVTPDNSPDSLGTLELIHKLDYLEFPLHLKIMSKHSDARFFGYLGPNIGILLSAKETAEGYPIPGITDTAYDISSAFENVDFSLELGGGAEYRVSPEVSLLGEVSYSHGLTDLTRSNLVTTRSYGINIEIGVLFEL